MGGKFSLEGAFIAYYGLCGIAAGIDFPRRTPYRGISIINVLETPVRYAHTLRHLRTSQWLWLLRYRVLPRPQAALHPTAITWEGPVCARLVHYLALVQEVRPLPDSEVADLRMGVFHFLGESAEEGDAIRWICPERSRLWHYHLHYFDWAADLAAAAGDQEDAHALVEQWCTHWIDANPQGTDIAWDAYTTSKRIVNWLLVAARWHALRPLLAESLGLQVEYLARHLEYDIQANHLFTNGVALTLAGAALGMPRIQRKGMNLLERQIAEQILDDGGHYERSPMYHAEILRDLTLLHVVLAEQAEAWRSKSVSMTRYLHAILHRDGQIPLFGDAAEDPRWPGQQVVALARKVLRLRKREESGSAAFAATGTYCLKNAAGGALWIKGAGVSPHHQPGHTHCDMLSYEYDIDGTRVVVDSGTHGYAGSPYREYNRSTRAHNTVSLDGVEQHECWSTFRVARRGTCRLLAWEPAWAIPFLAARCENYLGASFIRVVAMPVGGGLVVADGLASSGTGSLTSWIHLHPQWEVSHKDTDVPGESHLHCQFEEQQLSIYLFGFDRVDIAQGVDAPRQGWYSPQMGIAHPAPTITLSAAPARSSCVGYALVPTAGEAGTRELWQAISQLHETLATST